MDHGHIWVRHEVRSTERRCAVTPDDARALVAAGAELTVEESPQRIFPLEAYAAAGARTAPAGSWVDAPDDAFVLGLKELPEEPDRLRHRHVFFGHAFKGQAEAAALLERFRAGGGTLLDLEYLVGEDGRRVAAFGYWAGYLGAALGVLQLRGGLAGPLTPTDREALDARLRATTPGAGGDDAPVSTASGAARALVTGALGRSGRGAMDALAVAGISGTGWDREQTRDLDRAALLDHDLLVHCVLATVPSPAFVRPEDATADGRRLSLVVDVTCDTSSELNLLPVYRELTSWQQPVDRLSDAADGLPPLDVIAIDNLPSLLPLEASRTYSADLLPTLLTLVTEGPDAPVWARARATFQEALASGSAHGSRG